VANIYNRYGVQYNKLEDLLWMLSATIQGKLVIVLIPFPSFIETPADLLFIETMQNLKNDNDG